jgi:hypothetical protein
VARYLVVLPEDEPLDGLVGYDGLVVELPGEGLVVELPEDELSFFIGSLVLPLDAPAALSLEVEPLAELPEDELLASLSLFFFWPVCLPWFVCSRPWASRVTFGLSVGPAPLGVLVLAPALALSFASVLEDA